MFKISGYRGAIEQGGNDFQFMTTARTVRNVNGKYPFEKSRPAAFADFAFLIFFSLAGAVQQHFAFALQAEE
jgi:hypothetical protein